MQRLCDRLPRMRFFKRQFFMGFSPMDINFKDHVGFMPGGDRARFSEIVENHHVESTRQDKPIYCCQDCGDVEMKRYALVVYDDGSVLETKAVCPRCGKNMQIVRRVDEITTLNCPECWKGRIAITDAMLWD